MQLVGAEEKNPNTAEEFLEFIDEAKTHRSTAATTKNDQSSRSHSICRIRITSRLPDNFTEGQLLLVDLAGSEASSDTSSHSRERMLETREINKSLSVLKECITKRAQWTLAKGEGGQKHVHIPFRGSKLTQVLKSAFDVTSAGTVKTIVVACIAPGILDVGHSKNTLRYAESMSTPILFGIIFGNQSHFRSS
jgi:kinesin family protein 2/24